MRRGHIAAGATRIRGVAAGFLAATLLGPLVAPAPAQAARAAEPAGQRPVVWTPCAAAAADDPVRCATVTVPVDWADPGGPTLDIAVARRPATAPDRRVGPLLYQPGAAASGVDAVVHNPQLFSAGTTERFDLIGVDPRGTGRSHPVLCDAAAYPADAGTVPATPAAYSRAVEAQKAFVANCRAQTGPVFDHMDARSVARDLDAVRAALGERRLSYYGDSYGTLVGQAYAELFPTRLRAAVWDSNMDHTTDVSRWVAERSAAVEDSFQGFFSWCDRAPSCAQRAGGSARWYDRLRGRAERGELTVTLPGTPPFALDGYLLGTQVAFSFFQRRWPELSRCLGEVDANRPGCLFDGSAAEVPSVPPGKIHYPQSASFCADHRMPVRGFADLVRLRELALANAPHSRLTALAWSGVTDCLGRQDDEVKNPQQPLRLDARAPTILLTNSRHDPSTPHGWARKVSAQAGSRARLLTYEGWGHGNYWVSGCISERVDRYLATSALPPRGASCPAVPEP
ncbi:alpha/beta fold hydrolase [Streptomyces kanamyceticus]|uniref:alpha/beta fold hydrolase n=1 Tax=Streptomyces kanamyceticus TaxID=1967 RepID=UPI0006E303A6|nr:alpha/beta fold hydrolase [Streptomyces kanamyceticus]